MVTCFGLGLWPPKGGNVLDKKFLYIMGGIVGALLIVLIIVFALPKKKKTNTATKSTTTNILTVWGTENERDIFNQYFDNFRRENKRYSSYKLAYVAKDPEFFLEESLNSIAADKGPDIWIVPNSWMAKYHGQMVAMKDSYIADAKTNRTGLEVYKDKYYNVVSEDSIINDKIYGIPLYMDTLRVFYNTDLFNGKKRELNSVNTKQSTLDLLRMDKAKNWTEFLQVINLMAQKNGQTIDQPAIALGTVKNIPAAADILNWLMLQNGAKMTSDDLSTAQFHTSQNLFGGPNYPAARALSFYKSFADPQSTNYTWNDNFGDAVRMFAEGKLPMMIDYAAKSAEIRNINPKLNYSYAPLPQINESPAVNFASYKFLTVTKASKIPDTAWEFMVYFTNNYSSYRSNTKKQSPLKNASISIADATSQALTAKTWFNPYPSKVKQIFDGVIEEANQGGDIQTALTGAASQITTLLQRLKNE